MPHAAKLYLRCYWPSISHQLTVPSNWISIILSWEIPSDKQFSAITTLGWNSRNGQEKSNTCTDTCTRKLHSITLSLSGWSNYQLSIMSYTEIVCKLYSHKKHQLPALNKHFLFFTSSLPLWIQPGRYYKHIFPMGREKVIRCTLYRIWYKTQVAGGRMGQHDRYDIIFFSFTWRIERKTFTSEISVKKLRFINANKSKAKLF